MSTASRPANRLAQESSPYLLQHAHNPVDWYPWGPEAFAAAASQNRPIFLSVGYSTCYWCHVMERQSFENETIAAEMNRRFINIKVDREERPDVDQLYMNAVHAIAGQGGWPMSVFLTPQLKPFYAGTYFPPTDMRGRMGFPRLIAVIDDAWKMKGEEVARSADELVDVLRRMAEPPETRRAITIDEKFLADAIARSTSDYDPADGGFGAAPKFPRQTLLEFLLTAQSHFPDPDRLKQVLHTLDAMAAGGIRDHLGGAFHRYSTDDHWLVPHFEIMLYDNAMLAFVYTQAHAQTKDDRYARIVRGILDFILREMTSLQGAFYTAFDAEVDAQEGLSYLWTPEEIGEVLGKDSNEFNRVYGVSQGPNFVDPHHGGDAPDKNILFLPQPLDAATDDRMKPSRQALYEKRRQRKQPLLDTKILTSWNALMIRALSHAGQILSEPIYQAAAAKAADFLWKNHRTPQGDLYRMSKDGSPKGVGFLDDYAFFSQALLALNRRDNAKDLATRMTQKFQDPTRGGFFFTSPDANDILVRQKTASDSPLPSGNAIAADVMLELGDPASARQTLEVFAGQLDRFGPGMSALMQTALQYVLEHGPIRLESGGGAPSAPDPVVKLTAAWLAPDVLNVTVHIAPDFHINGPEVAKGLTPTRLRISDEQAAAVKTIDYPTPQIRRFEFADDAIPVYEGTMTIPVHFSRPISGERITLALKFQACTQTECLAAQTQQISLEGQK